MDKLESYKKTCLFWYLPKVIDLAIPMLGIYNKENVSTGAMKDMYEKALRSFTHNSPTWNNTLTSITVRRDVCIVVCPHTKNSA